MAILTLHTMLLDETLDGARIIDMGSAISCECFVLPRDKVAEVGKHYPRLQQYGLYILLGSNHNKKIAYIGQTYDFTHRVIDHKQKKDFWDIALVFVSKSNEIYSSEAQYLEYLGWKAAKEADNYIIENTKEISKPRLPLDKQNDMERFFKDIVFITRFYGCKVFDKPEEQIVSDNYIEFTMSLPKSGMKAELKFYKESQRYVIAAGSTIMAQTWDSCSKGMQEFRKQVIENKKRSQKNGELCLLLQDVEMPETSCSPSGAASFCVGTSRQGTKDWKDNENKMYPTEWWKESMK